MAPEDKATGESDMASAASALLAEVATFENLTSRLSRLELTSQEKLSKAGELLNQAGASHLRFVQQLKELILGIEDARKRQNESAATLSGVTEQLEARRGDYKGLQERFRQIGVTANEIGDLLKGPEDEPESVDARKARLGQARERLAQTVDAAHGLLEDARAADWSDLTREADALWQRLSALTRKLDDSAVN